MVLHSICCGPMVPALPFAFLFAAIVGAQAPECYTLSGMFLGLPGCLPPKPPELSIQHFLSAGYGVERRCLGLGAQGVFQAPNASLHDQKPRRNSPGLRP